MNLSHEQARELAHMGAFIEHAVNMYYRDRPEWAIGKLVDWIKVVGVEHTTLGSDTGQATSPLPSEVFGKVAHELVANSVAEREVRRMLRPGQLTQPLRPRLPGQRLHWVHVSGERSS